MYGTYSAIDFYNKTSNLISLIIIGLCILYFLFNIKKFKIKYNAFSFILIMLIVFEFSIILLRNTLEFPYYIIDTFLWPFIFMVFMNYTSKNRVPKSIINSIFYIYLIIIFLSVLLVIKHHTYGNYGEYIFKAYYSLTFLPLLLKIEKVKSCDLYPPSLDYNLNQLTTAILFDMTTNCDTEKELEKLTNAGFTAYSFTKDFLKDNDKVKDSDLEI